MRGMERTKLWSYRNNSVTDPSSAASSHTSQKGRTENANTALSVASSRSERCIAETQRPAWLPHAMSNHINDAGDTTRSSNRPRPPTTPNGAPDTERSTSTYDSHRNTRPELIRFDRWINRQPISDVTNKPHVYNTTQLITQTQPETKKIVWIYSFKNRHLLSEDVSRVDSESPNTTESDKSDCLSGARRPCKVQHEAGDKIDGSCDSWSCYDTNLKGSPRYPNTCMPVYIPSLKMAATRFSLETVHEVAETDKSESRAIKTSMNPHISAETLQSVKHWIDGSKRDESSTSSKIDFSKETQRSTTVISGKINVIVKPKKKHKPPLLKIDSFGERNDKIDTDDWITEETCVEANPKEIRKRRIPKRLWKRKVVRVGNTICPDAYASARLHARAMAELRASPWDMYYAAVAPERSEVVEMSFSPTEMSRRERRWRSLSRYFCKCFGCRK